MHSQMLQELNLHPDASGHKLFDMIQVLAGTLMEDCLRSTFTFGNASSSQGHLEPLQQVDLSACHFNHT